MISVSSGLNLQWFLTLFTGFSCFKVNCKDCMLHSYRHAVSARLLFKQNLFL